MTDWRTVKSLARPHDTCDGCDSLKAEEVYGRGVELCGHDQVRAAFGRARISAGLARDEVCGGRFHPKFRETA